MVKKKTTTAKKRTTKKVVKDTESGLFASPKRTATDKAGTMTLTVPKDKDGVRSDKGGTHKRREVSPDSASLAPNVEAVAPDAVKESVEVLSETPAPAPSSAVEAPVPENAADVSPDHEKLFEESKPLLPCLTRRPNRPQSYTCLDEVKEAVEHPEQFTEVQYQEIISDNNLCENCRKNQENEG